MSYHGCLGRYPRTLRLLEELSCDPFISDIDVGRGPNAPLAVQRSKCKYYSWAIHDRKNPQLDTIKTSKRISDK